MLLAFLAVNALHGIWCCQHKHSVVVLAHVVSWQASVVLAACAATLEQSLLLFNRLRLCLLLLVLSLLALAGVDDSAQLKTGLCVACARRPALCSRVAFSREWVLPGRLCP
jgi:hypothetical protein